MDRSKNVKKNIIYSFFLKVVGVGLTFLQLPLTVHYLTEVEYGVWVTLFTVMNWVNMLDMGIGLGMRNKLAEAVSKNDAEEICTYISTGIFAMMGMGILLLLVFLIGIHVVSMRSIFNTALISEPILYTVSLWTGIFVIVSFVLSIINQIYYAYQNAAITGIISIVHSVVMLIGVYYLTLQQEHSLLYFVFAFGVATISSKVVFIIIFFYKQRNMIPRFCYVAWEKVKAITSIGIQFFVIQICCIFGYVFSNVIVTQLFGPEYVRTYDILFKVINISMMIQTLALNPIWSAYTDAYVKKDYTWIKNTFWKTCQLSGAISVGIIILSFFINPLIYLWMHIRLEYSPWLVVFLVLYHIAIMFNNAFCMLLNGIGNIRIQMYGWILTACSVVPLSYFFVRQMNMGLEGIALGMTLSFLFLIIVLPIQIGYIFHKEMGNKLY